MTIPEIISAIQAEEGITVDGYAGPQTWRAIYGHYFPTQPIELPGTDPVDERSEKNIATLHPRVQPLARALVHAAAQQGLTIKVIDGSRTYDQQNALYEQGRSRPGDIVTNARGGQSWHNFGLAFDIGVFQGARYLEESPAYAAVGALGNSLGLEWGGSWTGRLVDEPHFQFNPNHLGLADMRARHDAGTDLFA